MPPRKRPVTTTTTKTKTEESSKKKNSKATTTNAEPASSASELRSRSRSQSKQRPRTKSELKDSGHDESINAVKPNKKTSTTSAPSRSKRVVPPVNHTLDTDSNSMHTPKNTKKNTAKVTTTTTPPKAITLRDDLPDFILLVVLYLLQGIPLGLSFGSLPFLLKSKLSYSQLALFSLSSYPYSLKLLWSPIVDSTYFKWLGRRKSWILPMQFIIGAALIWLGMNMDPLMNAISDGGNDDSPVWTLSLLMFGLVFFSATQDIAVDGWALTLLRKENVEYASTAQTIGLNTGYFLSFTVFLALNSSEFCNRYIFSTPQEGGLVSLNGYMQFWGVMFWVMNVWLILFKRENGTGSSSSDEEEHADEHENQSIKSTYQTIFSVITKPNMLRLMAVLLLAKIGFMANESVTGLKLLEKGFHKEDLALAALLDFPCQILGGWVAAQWSNTGNRPLRPWLYAFYGRLAFALIGMGIIYYYPVGVTPLPWSYFVFIMVTTVLNSFMSTIQFVGMGAYFSKISDPVIGGTYMTLLNTISNFGGTWPKYPVLLLVDYLSDAATGVDGYYLVNVVCVVVGLVLLWAFIQREVARLEVLPVSVWRLHKKSRHNDNSVKAKGGKMKKKNL